jgi:hypothetical protein
MQLCPYCLCLYWEGSLLTLFEAGVPSFEANSDARIS